MNPRGLASFQMFGVQFSLCSHFITNNLMKVFVFNNTDDGRVWSVRATNKEEAESKLPADVEWDDYFELEDA